jgi:hypothetical protein
VLTLWATEKITFWLAQRWFVAGWLIAFEILIAENGLLIFIKAF